MLEQLIKDLIEALNRNTAALLNKAPSVTTTVTTEPAPAKEDKPKAAPKDAPKAETPKSPEPEKPTLEQVLEVAQDLLTQGKKESIRSLNEKHGLAKIRELVDKPNGAEIFAELKALRGDAEV